jgi:hypothetical protein
MGFNPGPIERQDVDIWDRTSYGWTQATTGGITTGSSATVTVTVPGATTAAGIGQQPWVLLSIWTSTYIGNLIIEAYISAANTATVIIHNNSGGTITPPANTNYGVIFGRINPRFTQPNVPGGTSG